MFFFLYLIMHAHYSLCVISCAELAAGIRAYTFKLCN